MPHLYPVSASIATAPVGVVLSQRVSGPCVMKMILQHAVEARPVERDVLQQRGRSETTRMLSTIEQPT
jgi:hypothetical protein